MNLITSSTATLIGIVGAIASILSVPDPLIRYILCGFFVLLTLVGVYSFADSKLNFKNAISVLQTSKKLGVANLHAKGNSGSKMSAILREGRIIRIFAMTGIVFIRTFRDELIEALAKNNASILCMLSDSPSQYIHETEIIESDYRVGQIKDEMKQVVNLLKEYIEDAKKKSHGQTTCKVSIAYFNTQLRLPMILCDQSYGWVTLTLPPKRSSQSVSLELLPAKDGLLEDCLNHFNRIWNLLEKAGKVGVVET